MENTYTKALLNATAIGKHFNASSQKINLILSELGFIENNVDGWKVAKLGSQLGGQQRQHDQSGKWFVLWPGAILTNKDLARAFEITLPWEEPNGKQGHTATPVKADNFRNKYPAAYRTRDGHFVRSKSEVIIDDCLYNYGLVHSYERKLPIEEDIISDFYIPSGQSRPQAVFIEYWGMEDDPKYVERMRRKIEIYRRNELPLIELFEADIQNIDDILPRKLLQFKIKVG